MKRFHFLTLSLSLLFVLLLAGCFGGQEGPPLFGDDEEEIVDEVTEGEVDGEGVVVEAPEEFGFLVEGTVCTRQLHGGCVPHDFRRYTSKIFGLQFMYPTDWITVSASDIEVSIAPTQRDSEEDPTLFLGFRSVSPKIAEYEAMNDKLIDTGKGRIGDYDANWEIYEGEWNGQPVKSEWVRLTVDPDNPWINFIFVLRTEPENFLADQMVIKGAVSSILMEEKAVEEVEATE